LSQLRQIYYCRSLTNIQKYYSYLQALLQKNTKTIQ
jgi:hypothetical protein